MKEENESGVDLATNSVYSKIILKKYIIFTQIILVEQFLGWIWGGKMLSLISFSHLYYKVFLKIQQILYVLIGNGCY